MMLWARRKRKRGTCRIPLFSLSFAMLLMGLWIRINFIDYKPELIDIFKIKDYDSRGSIWEFGSERRYTRRVWADEIHVHIEVLISKKWQFPERWCWPYILYRPWSSDDCKRIRKTERLSKRNRTCRPLLLVLVTLKTVDLALKSPATIKKRIVVTNINNIYWF